MNAVNSLISYNNKNNNDNTLLHSLMFYEANKFTKTNRSSHELNRSYYLLKSKAQQMYCVLRN